MLKYFFFIFFLFLLQANQTSACTSFSFFSKEKEVFAAKNYDWFFAHGHGGIFVYPRNSLRIAFTPQPDSLFLWLFGPWLSEEKEETLRAPLRWRSRYGSVTLTQFGKGLPIGGMNEKGLVVEMLQLNATEHPPFEAQRSTLNESQWTLYQLDQFASIQEVAQHLHELRITKTFIGVHYFLTDASGASAVVEFLDGAVRLYHKDQLPVAALTNDPYAKLLTGVENHAPPASQFFLRSSFNRFATAAMMLRQQPFQQTVEQTAVDHAFAILSAVAMQGTSYDAPLAPTQWSLVYDITHKSIHFKTRLKPEMKRIHMKAIDFNQLKTVQFIDMDTERTGDLTPHLHAYSAQCNTALVNKNSWLFSSRLRQSALAHAELEGYFYPLTSISH